MKVFFKKHLKKILSVSLAVIVLASVCVAGTMTSSASGTGAGLAEWALNAYYSHWSYVYGGATPGAVDCSGLIYSYCGGERCNLEYVTPEIGYVSSGIPRVHGLGLHQPGHFGVYIGDGMAVDARDESSGVCYDSVSGKSWVEWFKVAACTYITNGWEQFNGNYYYYENGEYVVNTSRVIGGVTYNFNSSGASDKTPEDMNAVANNSGGASSTSTSSNTKKSSSDSTGSDNTSSESDSKTLKVGSSGDSVTKLQERLAELGYYDGEITGYYGELTEAAYKKFQKAAGLSEDGVAGEDEQALLFSDEAPSAVTEDTDKSDKEDEKNDGTYKVGDQGDEVSAIQQKLMDLGYYYSEITGYFGEATEQAVKEFQLANGLEATGIVDEYTYEIMFSEIAEANATAEEVEEEVYEEETVEETEPETVAPVVEQPKTIAEIAGDNLAVAQKVVVKTNRLTKNALKSFEDDVATVTAKHKNNSSFLIWMFVVLAIAAAVSGVLFINSKRNAAYSGARMKENKKKSDIPVRYW